MSSKTYRDCGTQAGVFDMRPVANYIVDLLEKCHEIHEVFKKCQREMEQSRGALLQSETELEKLHTTVDGFGQAMDSLGMNMLQDNMAMLKINGEIEKLRKEIGSKKVKLGDAEQHTETWEKVHELRRHRDKLELHLKRVKNNIEVRHEEVFEMQEKIEALKAVREARQETYKQELERLEAITRDYQSKKQQLLDPDSQESVDLASIYVSPADFRRLEIEIEDMRHQQIQVDRHIQMQLEERDFLRGTAIDIIARVVALEKQVRKETGDHGWESSRTQEPDWYTDVGTPTVWCTVPTMTTDQLQLMLQRQNRRPMIDQSVETEPTTRSEQVGPSQPITKESVVIDLTHDTPK